MFWMAQKKMPGTYLFPLRMLECERENREKEDTLIFRLFAMLKSNFSEIQMKLTVVS